MKWRCGGCAVKTLNLGFAGQGLSLGYIMLYKAVFLFFKLEKEQSSTVAQDVETGVIRGGKKHAKFFGLLSPILLQAFTLTFLAEWGDRSQIATILLASREVGFSGS